jgi:hypothetical protein
MMMSVPIVTFGLLQGLDLRRFAKSALLSLLIGRVRGPLKRLGVDHAVVVLTIGRCQSVALF